MILGGMIETREVFGVAMNMFLLVATRAALTPLPAPEGFRDDLFSKGADATGELRSVAPA